MTPNLTPHPSREELYAFQAGQLTPDRSQEIDAHLDDCEACQAALPLRDLPSLPELPLPPGYDMIEEIGRGGMGVVYRARRRSDGREFAIKTLLPDYRRDPTYAAYLEREAEMTARVRHLRVLNGVQLRRYSEADPTPFIEFPWVPGTTLAKMIGTPLAREHPLRLVKWLIQCCQAVTAAHQHVPPIVHFDLKPENLLVYDHDGEAVLIDFGLASEWPPPSGVTRAGMGTPAYMAPEVATGREDQIGPRTDVFALGGMLCAILTGRPPYDRADFRDTAGVKLAAREVNLGPALHRLDSCREHRRLANVARRCLSPDPADRPEDASAVCRELEKLTGTSTRRQWNLVSRILLVLALVALGACLLLALLFHDRPPTKEELLTPGPWARYLLLRHWTPDELAEIHRRYPRRYLDKKGQPIPPEDRYGNVIFPAKIGAYPLVSFQRLEWVESVTLSYEGKLTLPRPHNSDFTFVLPAPPPALVEVPLPATPGWSTATTGQRLCKKALTVTVALTNGQYVNPFATATGGVVIGFEQKQYGLGTELANQAFLSGMEEQSRGGGSRAYVAVEALRKEWEEMESVKLQVKLRGRPTIYEYDLHPRKLGWEKKIRDGESD